MLTREQLESDYLTHLSQARDHLDAVRAGGNSVTKGMHIAQALACAQLATAAATALANAGRPIPQLVPVEQK